jgi:hypothetical protein
MRGKGARDARRGFVATFVTCALATLLILLVAYSQPSLKMRDRYLADYAGSAAVRQLFDNAGAQVSAIAGINASFLPTADGNVTASFSTAVLSANTSEKLSNYSSYLSGAFSQAASAVLNASFDQITGDRLDLMSNTTDFFIDRSSRSLGFEPSPGSTSTGFSNLSLALVFSDSLNESTPWAYDGSGDVNFTLSITTANGTSLSNGRMSSSTAHYYWLNFSTGAGGGENVAIYFGSIGAKNGVLRVNSTGVAGSFNATVVMPYASSSLWYYNATLNATKAAISRQSKLIVWEGG